MPYPLEKLKYGLRRRLRELTTPGETYAFQIAAPHYSGFQPIQKCQRLRCAALKVDEQYNIWMERMRVQPDQLFRINNIFFVIDNLTAVQKSMISDHFWLNPESITLRDRSADMQLIQTFNSLLRRPVDELSLEIGSISVKNAIKMIDDICSTPAFKTITTLRFYAFESLNTWIKALDKMKNSSLTRVCFYNVTRSSFNFHRDRFYNFFKNQSSEFEIYFRFTHGKQYFNYEEFCDSLFRGFRCVDYNDSNEDLRQEHYVPVAKKVTLDYGWGKRYYWQ